MDYASSGVNINEGNNAVNRIKPLVQSTFTSNVLTGLGQFASFYELPKGYDHPVLVSCTDGVGTKLKLAIDSNRFDTVGVDLVAMCVNDLICAGAKPLYFLDYIAVHALDPNQIEQIMMGMVNGCNAANCSLVGGEMAEMNDMYKKGDFDLAGFCVGVVDRAKVIDGSTISDGDYIYALPSSGIHSNGYSLVRKVLTEDVCKKNNIDYKSLLEPTTIYVKQILDMIKTTKVSGIANITGGGLAENIKRIVPKNVDLRIEQSKIKVLPIFDSIQKCGTIKENEMYRVFNMGVGMVVISPEKIADSKDLYYIGNVQKGSGDVSIV